MERLGRYEILEELGRGAMGRVYRARDPQIDRVVALKTVTLADIDPAMEGGFRQRFFREAKAAGRLSHAGIVTIFDAGEDPESKTPFIVMEYIEGTTLEVLGRERRLPRQRRSSSSSRWPRPSTTPIGKASSTATSSRPTSS